MNIRELKEKLLKLDQTIEAICQKCCFRQASDSLLADWNADDPDEAMMYDEFHDVLYHLLYVHRKLSYLQSPVVHSGILHKDRSGRYTLNGLSLKTGSPLKFTVLIMTARNTSGKCGI